MADKTEPKLKETKGQFKLQGIVTGIERDSAYGEGTTSSGKEWKRLRFGVQTSPTNTVYVQLFGMERDFVYGYNREAKESKRFDWSDRDSLDEGFQLIGVNVALEESFDGKIIRDSFAEYDVIDYIRENLTDGDSVYVNGKIEFSEYQKDESTPVKLQTNFVIQAVGKTKEPIDFEIPYDEKTKKGFKEVCEFEQEIVIVDPKNIDRETNKQFVSAYYIGYGEKFSPAQFVINMETHSKLATNVGKNLKFGDTIQVYGKIINATIEKEAEDSVSDDWGSDENTMKRNTIKDYISEMQIRGVEVATHKKKVYKEEDFVKDEAVEDWGASDDNPFANDNESDEELPF